MPVVGQYSAFLLMCCVDFLSLSLSPPIVGVPTSVVEWVRPKEIQKTIVLVINGLLMVEFVHVCNCVFDKFDLCVFLCQTTNRGCVTKFFFVAVKNHDSVGSSPVLLGVAMVVGIFAVLLGGVLLALFTARNFQRSKVRSVFECFASLLRLVADEESNDVGARSIVEICESRAKTRATLRSMCGGVGALGVSHVHGVLLHTLL
jgi:hypothetical protein